MSDVQDPHGTDRADQDYDVEPAVIKVEMYVPQNLGNDNTVVGWQVHPHQQDTRHEVHAHYLCEKEDEEIAGFGAGDGVEPLD